MDPQRYVVEAMDNKQRILTALAEEMKNASENMPAGQVNPSVDASRIASRAGVSTEAVLFLVRDQLTDHNVVGDRIIRMDKGGCFIATAAYGSAGAPEVRALRRYRDEVLMKSIAGRYLVSAYYAVSPHFARLVSRSEILRAITRRWIIRPALKLTARWTFRRALR